MPPHVPLLQTMGSPNPCLDQRWPSKSGFLYFTTPHSAHLKPALPLSFSVVLSASDVEGTDCAEKDPAVQKPQECQKHLAVWQDHGELNNVSHSVV